MAGLSLTFDVEVTDVRDATAEEISHGHVHGPGGIEH
jgi:FKBP-type peptidyl-prolyl cis-trans isomerase SlyD